MPQYIDYKFDNKLIDKHAIDIIAKLTTAGFTAYLVGGCVRDLLLSIVPKDFDIVTNANPEQIIKLFSKARIIGRRFKIVHIIISNRHFYELSTFRGKENNTTLVKNNNNFGTIKTDAFRRDFTINALYYNVHKQQIIDFHDGLSDIFNKKLIVIGDENLRFKQDPVRILRVIRFCVKLKFTITDEIEQAILTNKHLLADIPPARIFEECLKLFHNVDAYNTYLYLQKYKIFQYLFPNIERNDRLVKVFMQNTAIRIKQNLNLSPAFIFIIFLYKSYFKQFINNKKNIKSLIIASENAASAVILIQKNIIFIPKWSHAKIKNTWIMQYKLEQKQTKQIKSIISAKDFKMALDFLILRSMSIDKQLTDCVSFWQQASKKYL